MHFAGFNPATWKPFIGYQNELRAFRIMKDASHALLAQIPKAWVTMFGCGKPFSDICVFSFHPVKIITSAEGWHGDHQR